MPVVIEEELTQRGSGRGVLETSSLVVDAVAGARRGIGITALAAQTGLPKSTVHRIAGQLTESGLLERVGQRVRVLAHERRDLMLQIEVFTDQVVEIVGLSGAQGEVIEV